MAFECFGFEACSHGPFPVSVLVSLRTDLTIPLTLQPICIRSTLKFHLLEGDIALTQE